MAKPWKSPRDILMRRPAQYFVTVLNRLTSTNLPKTLNYIQYRLLCVTQATYRAIKVINDSWKIPKDVLMRRPATYFLTVLNRLTRTNLPKTLKYIQYRLLHVTQVTYGRHVRMSPAYSLHRRSCVIPKVPIMRGKLSIMTYDDMAVIPAMKISLRYLQDVICPRTSHRDVPGTVSWLGDHFYFVIWGLGDK